MADLKISQFVDGGTVLTTDQIAAVRGGVNTKVFVGSAAGLDTGTGVGDIPVFSDDGGGNAQYPAADGSLLTGIVAVLADGDYGDIVVSSSGTTWTIENDAVTDTKIRNSAGLSVVGRASNTTGDVADIVAAADGNVLRRSGTSIAWGAISLASANAVTGTLTVGNGGTGVATLTAYAPLFGGTTTTNPVQSGTVGTSGQVLTSNGAGALPTFQSPSSGGAVLQVVSTQYTTYSSGSGTIPYDNSIPQSSEGNEFFTVVITPTSASSTLIIRAQVALGVSTSGTLILAIFKDSGANAIAAIPETVVSGANMMNLHLTTKISAGSTSAQTFRVRVGNQTGTIYINGDSGGQKLGGVMTSFIEVMEVV